MEIMATVSFKTFSKVKIQEMVEAGANILRYNIAHGSQDEILSRLQIALSILSGKKSPLLLVDIPGTKPRLGDLLKGELTVRKGERYQFVFGVDIQEQDSIPVPRSSVPPQLTQDDVILIGDGEIAFSVKEVSANRVQVAALNHGQFRQGETLCYYNRPDLVPRAPILSKSTLEVLERIRPQIVALSFVNEEADIHRAREAIASIPGYRPELMSKVETSEALKNIESIVEATDSVLVGRGDLALFSRYEDLYKNQALCIRTCRARGRRCWVGTQLLDTAVNDFVPSRSNLCDVAALTSLQPHGLLLSRETGLADDPGHVIKVAKGIIDSMTNY